jgi:hypothetical protein
MLMQRWGFAVLIGLGAATLALAARGSCPARRLPDTYWLKALQTGVGFAE